MDKPKPSLIKHLLKLSTESLEGFSVFITLDGHTMPIMGMLRKLDGDGADALLQLSAQSAMQNPETGGIEKFTLLHHFTAGQVAHFAIKHESRIARPDMRIS